MANYTSVTASNICDAAGNKLASGTVSFQATDAANQPLNFQVGGGGQVVTTPATAAVTAGAIAGGFQVADSANTSPAGILYRITITDTTLNRVVVTYSLVTVTGTTFNLDTFSQTGAAVLPPVGGSVSGPLAITGSLSTTGSAAIGGVLTTPNIEGIRFADNFATINAAVADLAGAPGIVLVPAGTYLVSSTIVLGNGQHLVGTAPAMLPQSSQVTSGSIIKWTGATGTPVINVHNASGASVQGIEIDCNGTTGPGLLYDSNNTPSSTNCRFERISIKGFTSFGFVAGVASTTPDANGFQADTFKLEQFQFYGSGTAAIGILINSANAAQNSVIDRGNIQACNIGVRVVKSNGAIVLRNFNGGSVMGASPTFLQFDSGCGYYLMENMESEGNWTYVVHDSSTNSGFGNSATWLANSWNTSPAGQVLVDGNINLLSLGNTAANTTFSVLNGQANVISIGESMWPLGVHISRFSTTGHFVSSFLAATVTGNIPGLSNGDLASVRSATLGALWLGSDSLAFLSRDAAGNLSASLAMILGGAAPTVGTGKVGLGSTHATTVGAAGGATALPATPTGYLIINVDGTAQKIPYYNN